MTAGASTEFAARRAVGFVRAQFLPVLAISAALLLPCFWHRHIEAGDLASHTYNAWLAQLVERGQAPGLSITRQCTNVLVDVALVRVGSAIGYAAAEKIVVAACVLIFFWGAFALIAAASRQLPWFLIPAIAMVTYGWTFQMGFLNCYVSLGLGFFAMTLFWRGQGLTGCWARCWLGSRGWRIPWAWLAWSRSWVTSSWRRR